MRFPSRKIAHVLQVAAVAAAGFAFSATAEAQVPTSGNVFFGYSYLNTSPYFNATKRDNLNGWEGTLEGKVLPLLGLVADFSGHYGSQSFGTCPEICSPANFNEQNILFGPRVSVSLAGCGKTRFESDAVPRNSLVSTAQPDKKKVCVDKTSSSWMCSAT